MGRCFLRPEESILSKLLNYQNNRQSQCNPYQIINGIFQRTRQKNKILNLYGNTKDPEK